MSYVGATLVVAVVVLLALRPGDRNSPRPEEPADPRAAIRDFLTRQTGDKAFTPEFDLELTTRIASARGNTAVFDQRLEIARADVDRAKTEAEPLRQELEELHAEVQRLERAAAAAGEALRIAENRTPLNTSEVATLRSDATEARAAWTSRRNLIGPLEAQTSARDLKLKGFTRRVAAEEEAGMLARQIVQDLEHQQSAQENDFIRASRERASQSVRPEAWYRLIGEELTVAEHLLAAEGAARRQAGVSLSIEAFEQARDKAQNGWLAARICEAYLWANLAFADSAAGSQERAVNLLLAGKAVFAGVGETTKVFRSFELLVAHAPNEAEADRYRLEFAEQLERSGQFQRAVHCLTELQTSDAKSLAEGRLVRLKQRIPANP